LMEALIAGPVSVERLPVAMGCDVDRATRLAADMEREGLVIATGLALRLP
jgi:hypothetical protein